MITVIIPILNAMPFLPEALSSLEAQTFRDFEVCFWDNGSTDGSVEEAKRWIPERLPGRVVTGHPLPLHKCLARMVEESRTEFVARMDGDDVCFPERFQLEMSYLDRRPEISVLGGQMELINEAGVSCGKANQAPLSSHEILFSFLFSNPLAHPTVFFRKSAVLGCGNYSATKPVEDYDLWMRVGKANLMANLPEIVLKYRRHSNAVCGSLDKPSLDLMAKTITAVATHSEDLFGIPAQKYHLLREKKCLFSFGVLMSAIQRVSGKTGVSPLKVLTSPSVIQTARCLTAPGDFISKAMWRVLASIG